MSEERPTTIVLDATVLSNFASSNAISWLTDAVDDPLTAPAVRDEIVSGTEAGHDFLAPARAAVESGDVEIASFDSALAGRFDAERERLDAGEFEALLLAVEIDCPLATDDAAGREAAKSNSVDVTGSIGMLVRGVVAGDLSIDTANEWLRTWRDARGYYAPVENVEAALPKGYVQ